jgi:hypothetical protein
MTYPLRENQQEQERVRELSRAGRYLRRELGSRDDREGLATNPLLPETKTATQW